MLRPPLRPPSFASSSSASSSSSRTSSTPSGPSVGRPRPRGLWRGRAKNHLHSGAPGRPRSSPAAPILDSDGDEFEDDFDDDELDCRSDCSSSPKRAKHPLPDFCQASDYCWDYVHSAYCAFHSSVRPERPRLSPIRKAMDTTTTAAEGAHTSAKDTCDYQDWQDLKALFAKAAESYEVGETSDTLPLLRGVIHECHRFLLIYADPSVLFTSPVFTTPIQQEVHVSAKSGPKEKKDWNYEEEAPLPKPPSACAKYKRCVEIPTSFHTIMGTALFLFGNLIAQDPAAVLPGEPNGPAPYWLAALDVFESGENLPSRTNNKGCCCPEDWRMAIVWGRTLVCLADETISRARAAKSAAGPEEAQFITAAAEFAAEEHNWPADSPFATIASRRPPVTRRMSLSSASPNDLMVLAMDQFSRGIFHMPHPQHSTCSSSQPNFVDGVPMAAPNVEHFSRAKELFTLASEVLFVAERLDIPSERQYWASWADSVFNQMKMEANMDSWKGPITRSRGRCWLIVGSARAEDLEDALDRGEMEILSTEDAEEARDALSHAVTFFERAKGFDFAKDDPEVEEMQPLLAEALLNLANLTADEQKREALYARAQKEGGDSFSIGDTMDESD